MADTVNTLAKKASKTGKRSAIVPKMFGALWKLFLAPTPNIRVPDACPTETSLVSISSNFAICPNPSLFQSKVLRKTLTSMEGPSQHATNTVIHNNKIFTAHSFTAAVALIMSIGIDRLPLCFHWVHYAAVLTIIYYSAVSNDIMLWGDSVMDLTHYNTI